MTENERWIQFACAALSAGADVTVKDAAVKADKMEEEFSNRWTSERGMGYVKKQSEPRK